MTAAGGGTGAPFMSICLANRTALPWADDAANKKGLGELRAL